MALLFAPLLLLLPGCVQLPRDPDGTLDRVRREHRFLVGAVADSRPSPAATHVLRRLAGDTGARPVIRPGQLEPLLLQLEAGELDLVVAGRFDEKTPWATRVTLGEPLSKVGGQAEYAVARNGENAWITAVGRAARASADGAGS